MIKITKTYKDYNGVEKEGTCYFHLEQAEVLELETMYPGGLSVSVTRAAAVKDTPALFSIFKDLVIRAYGVKSADGEHFIKSEKVKDEFRYSKLYSMIFTELATDAEAASNFIEGVLPEEMQAEVRKARAELAKKEAEAQSN